MRPALGRRDEQLLPQGVVGLLRIEMLVQLPQQRQ